MPRPTVVVLGGGGRVGSKIVKSLRARKQPVIAVGRTQQAASKSITRVDVGNTEELRTFLENIHSDFYIVNCVLDTSSASKLVASVVQTADNISKVVPSNCAGIVSISSTAILSPRLLRTDYANAKIQELEILTHCDTPVAALLCPVVITSSKKEHEPVQSDRYVISADTVARIVGELLSDIKDSKSHRALVVPPFNDLRLKKSTVSRSVAFFAWQFVHALFMQLRNRDKAHYHQRDSTYALLRLAPRRIRRMYDHHLLPPTRIKTISKKLNFTLIEYNSEKENCDQ